MMEKVTEFDLIFGILSISYASGVTQNLVDDAMLFVADRCEIKREFQSLKVNFPVGSLNTTGFNFPVGNLCVRGLSVPRCALRYVLIRCPRNQFFFFCL